MLTKPQINQVRKLLIDSGVSYTPLLDELTDHTCEQVEELMAQGFSFSAALDRALDNKKKDSFHRTNKSLFQQLRYRTMIKSHIKLGIRALAKYRMTSVINLVGLVTGISASLIIGNYIYHETSFDQFHEASSSTFRLTIQQQRQDGSVRRSAFSGAPWGPHITHELPEARDVVRLMKYRLPVSVKSNAFDKQFYESDLIWADSSFFALFSFDLLKGNPATVLAAPNNVVISESAAARYFGNEDPIGKELIYETDVVLTVTGVVEDLPVNSHLQADLIGSFSTLGTSFWFNIIDNWNVLYYYTYLHIREDANVLATQSQIQSILEPYINENIQIKLQPVTKIHTSGNLENELSANTNISTLVTAAVVGLAILLLSIINYINLSNARALKRVKEVGVVKVLGSTKPLVFMQFMVESAILATGSFLVSLMLVMYILPQVRAFLEMPLILPPYQIILLTGVVLIALITISSGLYTSVQMADVSIYSALRGREFKNPSGKRFSLRKGLITFQFMAGLGLIASTLTISNQVNFLITSDTGFEKDGVIEIPLYVEDQQKLELLKSKLVEMPEVKFTALSSHRMSGDQLYRSLYISHSDSAVMGRLHVDFDFLNTFQIPLLAGRSFSKEFTTDTASFIINEGAVPLLGFKSAEDAVQSKLSYRAQNENGSYLKSGPIVGIVRDFNFESLHDKIGPMVMDIQPARNHFLNVKFNENQSPQIVIRQIESQWAALFPDVPFNFHLVNDRYQNQYNTELQLERIILVFTFLSLLIAMLGIFGLTYFDTAIRAKEIGLRKVLGASTGEILRIFLRDYFLLIAIGSILVLPSTMWVVGKWLESFAYHVDITFWNMTLPLLIVATVVVLTTSFIIVRAANRDAVDSLGYE